MKTLQRKKNVKRIFTTISVTCILLFSLSGCRFINQKESSEAITSHVSDQSSRYQNADPADQNGSEIPMETKKIEDESVSASNTEKNTESTTQVDEPEAFKDIVIELDPGHGGVQTGAVNEKHSVSEKDINLKIAQYLKAELEMYDGVAVYLTRDNDADVELENRVIKATADGADVIISLHNNASGPIAVYDHGCTVLTPRGAYREELSRISQELGCCILNALSETGLENQGLMFRICQNETTYPNGEFCDYYSIIRNSVKAGIAGIIVEHAFLDHEGDYENYLSDDSKIKQLALADAKGIAAYYGLRNKITGEIPEKLHNYEENIMLITSDDSKDNEYFISKYFTD